ncbi:tyrosinase family oxidase copper chaperone [Streptomyces sp. NPDC052687]|uniref:tyrosinase family oxidase copper chaperone n=1 Tax=Streptomyces sp. NPDC052687 TaxID=3154759 RepID=UPI00343A590D
MLWGLSASAVGGVFAPFLVASRPAGAEEARFAETYRGRRIVGVREGDWRSGRDGSGAWHVTVDGRPLHLMRRADGSWMSMVDHYCSYPTPLAAARAAVDELGPTEQLGAPDDGGSGVEPSRTPGGGKATEGDHHHGVHT